MSAAALDAQLTALSTALSVAVERPGNQGFPAKSCCTATKAGAVIPAALFGIAEVRGSRVVVHALEMRPHRSARWAAAKGARTGACEWAQQAAGGLSGNPCWGAKTRTVVHRQTPGRSVMKSSLMRPRVCFQHAVDRPVPCGSRCFTRGRVSQPASIPKVRTGPPHRFFGGRVDSRNSSVCSTWTMRPAPGVRMRSKSSSVARRPISEVGWRTVVRAG